MPFTYSHIGYVLPIKKKWTEKFSITGLVFGSLTPDFDILFRLTNVRIHLFQYNIKTIILLIFPLSLLCAFAFHIICRNILIENLPYYFEKKYEKYKSFNFILFFKKNSLKVSYSIIIAIYIHLFLDFLCHWINAFYLKYLVSLLINNEFIINLSYIFGIYGLPILFSIFGFYLIYKYEYHKNLPLQNFVIEADKMKFWLSLSFIFAFISGIKFYITAVDEEFFFDYVIISLTSSFLVALFATCALFFCVKKIRNV